MADAAPIENLQPHARVQPSVFALLSNIIDYAGLFPPAKLDMQTTVNNYAAYLASDDEWMLERLIVPVDRLDEFERCAVDLLPRGDDDDPWQLSALTVPAGDDRLEEHLERIGAFNAKFIGDAGGAQALIDVIELKASTTDALESALDLVPEDLYPFFEIPSSTDPRGLIATLVGGDAGAKIRTGGVTADLYPSADAVARFIAACAAADVPFKATAGLHHPLRHFSEPVQTREFGFLNVFVAAALAWYEELDAEHLLPLLNAESLDAFAFDDDGITIGDHRLSNDLIDDARLAFAASFGSCSFDEPRADLRDLGLL
jgi:hypothetical protein